MNLQASIKTILPIIVIAIAFGLFQYLKLSKPEREQPELKEKVWLVDAIQVVREQLSPSLELYGRVESPELLKAAAPAAGFVSNILVQSGAVVKQNELLVEMDSRDFETALVQSESDIKDIENQIAELKIQHQSNLSALETERLLLQLAEEEVQRMVELKNQNLGADTVLAVARTALGRQQLSLYSRELEVESYPSKLAKLNAQRRQDQARLKQARLALNRSRVVAPFDAVVSAAPVSSGDRVAAGQILVELYPIDSLEIRAHIPVQYLTRIQQSLAQGVTQYARIDLGHETFQLELKRLAGEAEPSGIDAYFKTEKSGQELRLGALLPLYFDLPLESDVIAVPYQAIYGNSRLYVLEGNRLRGIDVESIGQFINSQGEAQMLIKSDEIDSGDKVVVTHLPNAVSGLKVRSSKGETSQ